MSKAADYRYPDDEFDFPTGQDVPRGVHREPRSGWSRWWPFVVVIVLAPLLAYGAVTFITHDRAGSGSNQAAVGGNGDTGVAPPPTDTAAAQPQDTSPTTLPTEADTGSVKLTTPVTVLNAAKIQGLASRVATKLQKAGFTSVATGNSTGTTSTVYYTKPELQATAAKVGETLKIPTVTLDPTKGGSGVTVVLTTDPGL